MEKLEIKIQNILIEESIGLEAYKKIITLCKSNLDALRKKVKSKGFLNQQDEILFFKKTKQVPLYNYLYYSELLRLTLDTQGLSKKESKRFFRHNLNQYKKEIRTNKEFANYIRLGDTQYDRLYFVRREETRLTVNTISDPEFSTSHDFLMAKIKSRLKLINHIKEKSKSQITETNKLRLKWTASKVSLIELIYALHHAGVINDGKDDLKNTAKTFQNLFNVDLTDIYGGYNDIKSRKGERTKFLNELKNSLSGKIEMDDRFVL